MPSLVNAVIPLCRYNCFKFKAIPVRGNFYVRKRNADKHEDYREKRYEGDRSDKLVFIP